MGYIEDKIKAAEFDRLQSAEAQRRAAQEGALQGASLKERQIQQQLAQLVAAQGGLANKYTGAGDFAANFNQSGRQEAPVDTYEADLQRIAQNRLQREAAVRDRLGQAGPGDAQLLQDAANGVDQGLANRFMQSYR